MLETTAEAPPASELLKRVVMLKTCVDDIEENRQEAIKAAHAVIDADGSMMGAAMSAEAAMDIIRRDMESAGLPYQDEDGKFRDFHSLRHRFGSALAAANVPPKVAQTLMRHSTITLTMDRYSHVGLWDTAAAVDRLPPIPGMDLGSGPATEEATGTESKAASPILAHHLPTAGDGVVRAESATGVVERSPSESTAGSNPMNEEELCTSGRELTGSDGNTPDRIRTYNLRFRRPMLYPIELRVRGASSGEDH